MMSGMPAFASWVHFLRSQEPRLRGRTESRLRARSRARRAAFEVLEGRITPTTFMVINALDGPGDGPSGSLRNAIELADQSGASNNTVEITSRVMGSIALNSGELTIDTALTIVNRSGRPIEIRQETSGQRVFEVTSSSLTTAVSIGATSGNETITIDGGNPSTGNGGGILVDNPANVLTLTHVNLVGNSAGLASSSDLTQNGGGIDSSGSVVLVQSTVGTVATPNQTSGDGGGIWAGAGVSMTASTVNGNQAGTDGGGLYVNNGSVTMTTGSSVSGNMASAGTAGGLFVVNGNTTVSRSRIDSNSALDAGGLNEAKGNVQVIDGSEVNQNSSTASLNVSNGDFGGGGIIEGIGNVLVSRSQVSYNHSIGMYSSGIVVGLGSVTVTAGSRVDWNSNNGPGGGIAANFGGTVTVSGGSQVDHNTGAGNGGGIVNFAGPMGGVVIVGGSEVSHNTLTNGESLGQAVGVFLELIAASLGLDFTTATGGTSPDAFTADITRIEQAASADTPGVLPGPDSAFVVSGGGIGTLLGGSITVAGDSHVDDNIAGFKISTGNPDSIGIGGGLFSGLGSITVTGSTVDGNTALGSGGGIWNLGSMTFVASSLASNDAVNSPGGGLYNATGATASILRGTIKGNRASLGGGIYNRGTLSIVNSTVSRNHATTQGGGITNRGQMTLVHTTLVANTPDNRTSPG
jgi:fibronectin-binding autotransporter adhesin